MGEKLDRVIVLIRIKDYGGGYGESGCSVFSLYHDPSAPVWKLTTGVAIFHGDRAKCEAHAGVRSVGTFHERLDDLDSKLQLAQIARKLGLR